MARGERPYRRLPGRHRQLSGTSTLWTAHDHLLLVHTGLGYETYRRFHFRDIQTIVVRRTNDYLGWAGVYLTAMLFLAGMAGGQLFAWRRPWLVLLGGAGAFLLVHLVRGPTCAVHLTTTLGTRKLSPLHRLRQARRTLDRIRHLIEEAQGRMPAEEVMAQAAEIPAPAAFPAPSAPPSLMPPPLIRPGVAWPHAALCGVLALDAVVTGFQIGAAGGPIDTAGYIVYVAALAVALVATVRQAHSDLPLGLRRFGTSALVYLLALLVVTMLISMVELMRRAVAGAGPPLVMSPRRHGFLSIAEIVLDGAFTIWGLALLLQRRRNTEAQWIRLGT
jgi:hypothetical protein